MKFYDNWYFFASFMLQVLIVCCAIICLSDAVGAFSILIVYSVIWLAILLKHASDDYEELQEIKQRKREEMWKRTKEDASEC